MGWRQGNVMEFKRKRIAKKRCFPLWFAGIVFKVLLAEEAYKERAGDIEEIYSSIYNERGALSAKLWLLWEVIKAIPAFIKESVYWRSVMFQNYLKVALRNIKRQKVFSFINIVGLSIGLTVSILIFLLVRYERTYDSFQQNIDTLFRVADADYSTTAANLGQALKQEFPEIKHTARVVRRGGFLRNERGFFNNIDILCVDPEFFNMFGYPLENGNFPEPLDQPFQALITRRLSKILFGDEDPVGRTINYNDRFDLSVQGILRNIPENTHMKFDILVSMLTYKAILGPELEYFLNRWGSNDFWTYIQLHNSVDPFQLEKKFPQFEEKYKDQEKLDIFLQPVRGIHLSGNLKYEIENNSDFRNLLFLTALAILILLIASFNFMNLATAQVTKRSKEVGLRKVVGSSRSQLIGQFFGESMIFVLVSLAFSLLIVKAVLPVFNSFVQRNLELNIVKDPGVLVIFLAIAVFTGFASGFYPALFLSSFQPVYALKAGKFGSGKSLVFRNVLVIFQFSVTIFLIFSSLVIFNQLRFLKDRSFGNSENPIVNINILDSELRFNSGPLVNDLKKNPQVLELTSSYNLPIMIPTGNNVTWNGQTEEEKFIIRQTNVDYSFIDFYGIEIVKGRSFNKENATDKFQAVLINGTAAQKIGWEDPIGKKIDYGANEGMVIIGVMKDFNFKPLYNEIEPLVVSLLEDSGYFGGVNFISVKISASQIPQALESMEKIWGKHSPKYPFNYSFLDERIEARYQTEQKMGRSITYMAFIAIILACMGIFGLSLFTVEEKTKEIGIRKVLGANASNIVYILSREFVKWVLFGAALTFPIAWIVMNRWLRYFAYRTSIGLDVFIMSLTLTVLIAFLTVSFQSIKAALGNPANAIRHE